MKPRHLVLGGALAVAAGLVMFGDRSPSGDVVEPVTRSPAPAAPVRRVAVKAGDGIQILRLQSRATLVGEPDAKSGAEDAFATRNWTPPPPPEPPAPPPPPPAAPPLPFTFIGKSLEEGTWQVFLARGDRTYMVHDKDVVDGTYRVESIKPPLMTLTYLPLGQVQQINIGVFE